MTTVRIEGNTYRCKNLIKSSGGKFDPASKTWVISSSAWDILSALDGGHATAGCRVAGVIGKRREADQSTEPAPVRAYRPVTNSPCRKCGTYCYGDCTA